MQGWLNRAKEAALAAAEATAEAAADATRKAEEAARNASAVAGDAIRRGAEGENLGIMESMGFDPVKLPGQHESRFIARTPEQLELDALDMVYITPNIVAMGFPLDQVRRKDGKTKASRGNDINVVANYLRLKHPGRFMIWNVSEDTYDYVRFENQVLEFFFPGHPAPPLGLLFKICTSMDSWLSASAARRPGPALPKVALGTGEPPAEGNVAVVHCLSGKGRTATVLACYLAWSGAATSPMEGLQLVCDRKRKEMEDLTIPSQRRYLQYFTNMLDGVKPRSEPLLLRRCIMNTIPRIGDQAGNLESRRGSPRRGGPAQGCRPYLQVFKGGTLLFTTAWNASDLTSTAAAPPPTVDGQESTSEIPWCYSSDESIVFPINAPVQGDILVRLRHHAETGARVTMFRAAFHTGYVPSGVLRLTKSQLDGACNDSRFDGDFFIDLIFAPIEEANPSPNAPASPGAAISDKGLTVRPEEQKNYDDMLHRDARFWDEIARRKLQRSEAASTMSSAAGAKVRGSAANFTIGEEPNTSPVSSPGGGNDASGVDLFSAAVADNAELLAQLNDAEAEVSGGGNGGGGGGGEADLLGLSPKPKEGPSSELAELSELEKSLGLDDLDMDFGDLGDEEVGGDGAAADGDGDDFAIDLDEDLDGLEDYLQNLAATGTVGDEA